VSIEGILNGPDFSEAKCKGSGDIFFPEAKYGRELHQQLSDLKFICQTCPYFYNGNPCLKYAKSVPGNVGFWGGELLTNYAVESEAKK
jgi:hypothetical protein